MEEVVDPLAAVVEGLQKGEGVSIGDEKGKIEQLAHLALSNLIVVVRESEVDSSRVNVHALSKNCACHDTAFDVPSWSARTPRRGPLGLSGLRSLPQSKVGCRALAGGGGEGA